MGISRFKSLEDAERALWEFKPDHTYFERVRALFDLSEQLLRRVPQPGIRKYHSLEERAALLEKRL